MTCKICDGETAKFDRTKVLGKYSVQYYKCKNCGAIFTEEPYWLNEAYSDAISDLDVGLVSRNLNNVPILSKILDFLYPPPGISLLRFCRRLRFIG
ncbi:MAG: hypothetical protein IKN12_11900 [Selenomonadaceae bacterium]|nr:hypothetical protein [Selenomonadaceae bacterium]